MSKSAAEILQVVEHRFVGYEQMKTLRAKDSFKVLEKIINSIKFQRELAKDYLSSKSGRPVFSDYPVWAYTIAYKLYDPNREFGDNGKAGLSNLCQEMLKEFNQEDRYFTRNISQETDVHFLAQVALDLLAE